MVEFEDRSAVYAVVFLGEWDAKRKDLTPLFCGLLPGRYGRV